MGKLRSADYEPWQLPSCRPRWGQTVVYRFFDRAGQLLYVGITKVPAYRFSAHRSRAQWWPLAYCYTTVIYRDRYEAMDAESKAIKTEGPLYNKLGAVKRALV